MDTEDEQCNNKVYQETTLPLSNAATRFQFKKPQTTGINTAAAAATTTTTNPSTQTQNTIKAAIINNQLTTTTTSETSNTKVTTSPTMPQNTNSIKKNERTTTTAAENRRRGHYYNPKDKSDLGENFIAPDGGWAWLVCIAAGMSNLSIYPCLQQFGFIFRERLTVLGMTSSQITTIINTNPAVSACTGLLNGPMFRRFTFRQVAVTGSLLVFSGLVLTAFCDTFIGYMISYALLFGFGMGISVSASSLAINTYFKNKRRRAAGFSWTITGLGPIFLPYFVTFLLAIYGVQGTVLIFAALSLHSLVCGLIYQPVYHHAKQPPTDTDVTDGDNGYAIAATTATTTAAPGATTATGAAPNGEIDAYLCKYCTLQQKRAKGGLFSSQYLYQDDDIDKPGYEIIEPGTPMLSRANDGWYGSRISLASGKMRFRTVSSSKDLELATNRLNKVISEEEMKTEEFFKPNNFRRERDEQQHRCRQISNTCEFEVKLQCTCAEERALIERMRLEEDQTETPTYTHNNSNNNNNNNNKLNDLDHMAYNDDDNDNDHDLNDEEEDRELASQRMSFLQKVITFFDLDLLRDFTFVNLVAGLTIINFGELNFSILTPFILDDFGFTTPQITLAMSILAGMDITMRFLVPFLTEKMSWDNRVFFLIGVVGIALGRTVVACTRSYAVIICSFVWIGMCKGIRTIFWPLIIPGYVPLNRLPGASGLQLLISGIFTLLAGPFVGLVRDAFDYSVTLHCLNMMSFIAATSWTLEALIRRRRRKTLD